MKFGFARRWLRSVRPEPGTLRSDAIAGVPGAVGSVPDGMASAVLVGVNPVYGLYASFAGPIAGGLTASTRLMVITTTTAAALAAGSAVDGFDAAKRPDALFMLTVLAGAIMVVAGLARLGRYTRFVSFSVMIGFLTGVAANIIFGQIPDFTGVSATGDFALEKAWYVVTHPDQIELASLLTGAGALVLLVGLARTRLAAFSAVIALVIPTLLTLSVDSIARVEDEGKIPTGVPLPHLPDFGLAVDPNVLVGALSVAVIVLVQGVGVSEAAPNRDGPASEPNRDFIAQGVGNLASGLFRGQPVGGSVGQTALNVAAGARGRWASIFSGIWMLAVLVVFSGIVGRVVIPPLAAVLIFAAAGSLRSGAIGTILRTGLVSQIGFVSTVAATLFLPVAAAVGVGVTLSLLLQLNREALDLKVVRLEPLESGRFEESPAPAQLPSAAVTLLDVYGSLYYAGAKTLAARLPETAGAERPVVVLRLRGRTQLGASSLVVLDAYAERLAAVGGRLILSGVAPELVERLRRTGRSHLDAQVSVFAATEVVGDASDAAYREGQRWLAAGP
ncbi:SulP family inorganic anion transporter [Solirubrobacter ginsenosidimutans]|uniref:SulP family inorganic anion transporter n=1 Tax=Solirubrobacter ginsenosidimutans TaxID=490573 RepID=A0A9X3RZN2_9ACTN|nr:SulP family inorganic anion transporter [Solirubrobacter ginsenosidimutans]MDA0160409.1 SulP family inorganic anion transporter [Solirubrobacter ginsenosidimutans]